MATWTGVQTCALPILVIGGTVSAIATLLSAPSSGRELRENIKDQSIEWKEMLINLKDDGLRLKKQLEETSKEGKIGRASCRERKERMVEEDKKIKKEK